MTRESDLVDRIAVLEEIDQQQVSDDLKSAVKEALKEWLDEKILIFGKWSIMTVAAAGLAGLVYFIMSVNGWKHTP